MLCALDLESGHKKKAGTKRRFCDSLALAQRISTRLIEAMRRLKNIAENLEAIFRKREQEKTLNLQSLEERVLYSAVPLPVDLADAVANPQEPVDVGDLAAGQVEANVTSTLDQLDDLIADEATPELSGTIFTKPLPDDASERLGSDPYDPYETGEDPAESTSIPLTVDAPVAANLRVAVFGDFASFSINEGEVLQILDGIREWGYLIHS